MAEHDDTTTANCIRSHMWKRIFDRYDGKPEFHLFRLRGLNLLNWKDQFVFRFKKVDGSGRHQNYQTLQQKDFDDQLELLDVPPAAVRLTSGYQPDAAGQAIERIIVAKPLQRSIIWAAQVNIADGSATRIDITPARLSGTGRVDVRQRAAR